MAKKFLAGFVTALGLLTLLAVVENPALVKLNGVLSEVIINYSPRAMLASKTTVGYGGLPSCPDSSSTSDTPVSALQFTVDAGWVQCTSAGWLPLLVKGTVTQDAGIQLAQLPGTWLADGGFSGVGALCNCTLVTGTAPTACFLDGGFLNISGGSGQINFQCE